MRDALRESWADVAKKLIVEMENVDERVVFMIDEFPQLLLNVTRRQGEEVARSLLSWFRSLRMRQKDQLRRFRYLIGGSTSVDMILRRLDSPDKLNDFARIPVEPIVPADADYLIGQLEEMYGFQLPQESRTRLFGLIGPPVPYFIHLFVSQLILEPQLKRKRLTPEEVEAVYQRRMLGPTCRGYFDPYRLRLKRYGSYGERAAVAILREVAQSDSGRASQLRLYELYRRARKQGGSDLEFLQIMADLECDWYVALDTSTNEYYFLMDIMKDWWMRYYHRLPRRGK